MILPEVGITPSPLPIAPETRILCLGSCFVEHLHDYFVRNALHSFHRRQTCNHFNPASMAHMMRWVERGAIDAHEMDIVPTTYFDGEQGIYTSPHFRSLYAETAVGVQVLARRYLEEFRAALAEADAIVWTLGTADVLRAVPSGVVLCSGNGIASDAYQLGVLETAEIIASIERVLRVATTLRGGSAQQLVLSVSPQRYFWDALVQRPREPETVDFVRNSSSKSRLRCAIDILCAQNPEHLYFPSYELVLDQLRMVEPLFDGTSVTHVSSSAPEFVIAAFEKNFLSPSTKHYLTYRRKIERLLQLKEHCEGVDGVLMRRLAVIEQEVAAMQEANTGRGRLHEFVDSARSRFERRFEPAGYPEP